MRWKDNGCVEHTRNAGRIWLHEKPGMVTLKMWAKLFSETRPREGDDGLKILTNDANVIGNNAAKNAGSFAK